MNLKNYTSEVPAQRTISNIEEYLMAAGATGIMKRVENGQVIALVFEMADEDQVKRMIKLPANVGQVHDYIWKEYITSRRQPRKTKEDFLDQAARCAWRIVQDWVQVQVSMIKLKQMTVLQVFMPMIFDGQKTYYEYLQGNKFKALPHANGHD
jgi:hypothetical protein